METTSEIELTLAVCTYNRANALRKTLESFEVMTKPAHLRYEVLVVDNNCTDETPQVLDSFTARLPLRVVKETRQGIAHARNCVARSARGRYIVWTDDDVIVDRGWLMGYLRAFRRHPEAALFGGPIHPLFESDPPGWITQGWRTVKVAFAEKDLGRQPVALSTRPHGLPFGANYAVRRSEQLQHVYPVTLGHAGNDLTAAGLLLSEETEMMRAMLRSGVTGWWVPEASVIHCIPKERMTLTYLGRYFQRLGRTQTRLSDIPPGRLLLGAPLWLWRQLAGALLRYRVRRLLLDPSKWLNAFTEAQVVVGSWMELRRANR